MKSPQIEAVAIEQFALNVTVPILVSVNGSAALHASGTLFKIEEKIFIITARHIFDHINDLKTLSYPESPSRANLYTFGSMQILKPKEDFIDVAAIEVREKRTIDHFQSNWQFLSLCNVAEPSTDEVENGFFLAGYPASLTENIGEWMSGSFATAYTQRIPETPKGATPPVHTGLDLFFDYSYDAISLSGASIKTPQLPGASGASVWEKRPASNQVWTPEAATRVVGVQSSYDHAKYLRAKSWRAVALVLEQSDSEIGNAVRSKLKEI